MRSLTSMSSSSKTAAYCSLRIRDSASMKCVKSSSLSESSGAAASRSANFRCRSIARWAKALGLSGPNKSATGCKEALVKGVNGIWIDSSEFGTCKRCDTGRSSGVGGTPKEGGYCASVSCCGGGVGSDFWRFAGVLDEVLEKVSLPGENGGVGVVVFGKFGVRVDSARGVELEVPKDEA